MGWVFERVREIVVNVRGLTRHRARVRSVCIAVCVPKALGEGDYGTSLKGPLSPFQPYKLVKVELDGTRRPLTASELNALEKTHPDVCEWTTPLSQGKRKLAKDVRGNFEEVVHHEETSVAVRRAGGLGSAEHSRLSRHH